MSFPNGVFEFLETQYDQNVDRFSASLEKHYDQINDLDETLALAYESTLSTLKMSGDLTSLVNQDVGRDLHLIQSDVGDDEYTTTDSISIGPALIGFGPIINGLKISWKDSGISHYVGNYAEGWVITPPSAESTFEVVNRRHARSGVPFTLDMVKLKLLSPVRKQSQAFELDLESKVEHLAEIASWTDREWFTYDFHQMVLILATAVFDFEDAITFPYLYKTEGGCGGIPPYGNLDTTFGAMHFYTRGKSKNSIMGIMEESLAVNTGAMMPKDTFFLRNSHLANMGDKVWLRYESAYRSLLEQEGLSRVETNDLLAGQEASLLPDYLSCLGTEVEPTSFVVGAALSSLRKEGLLMSELDVKTALEAQRRAMAVMGDKPIGLLNKEIEEELSLFKGKHLKVLSQISELDPSIRQGLRSRGLMMPDKPNQEFRALVGSYYSMRSEEYSRYSTLYYTDAIRVFKTSEVRAVLEAHSMAVRADFARTDSLPSFRQKFLEENREERKRRESIHAWFADRPLGELLYQPLPPGVGTDDDRIFRSVTEVSSKTNPNEYDAIAIILFSGDRQLARVTAEQIRRTSDKPTRLIAIDRSVYTQICLLGALQKGQCGPNLKDSDLPRQFFQPGKYIGYYNFLLKRHWPLPVSIINQVESGLKYLNTGSRIMWHVEYDYPNMERGLDLIRVNTNSFTVEEYGGGYLERRSLRRFAEHDCWAKQDLDSIYSWSDFDMLRSKRHYPLPKRGIREDRIVGFDPLSNESYRRIDSWRRQAMRRPSWRSSHDGTADRPRSQLGILNGMS
jgi:hypothetical protein